jgi:uncharacterized protein involved in propanediol utilization
MSGDTTEHDLPAAAAAPVHVDRPVDGIDPLHGAEFQAVGCGCAIAHHGEILQGVFAGADGRLRPGLVTMPCNALRSVAVFAATSGDLSVEPAWRIKALAAARLTLAFLGRPHTGGMLTLRANIPVRWGLGSSTSDVVAAIRAVAAACQEPLSHELEAELAVRSEVASDSVMFEDRAVLFGQREGVIIEDLGSGLPPLDVVGLNLDPAGLGIDTLQLKTAAYSPPEIDQFGELLQQLRDALLRQDAQLVGEVASSSARINQRYLSKPGFEFLESVVEAVGAAGLQVAHSGCVAGLLFDARAPDAESRIAAASRQLAAAGLRSAFRFSTHRHPATAAVAAAGFRG